MIHHLLSFGLCCSMLMHGLILFLFCCSIGFKTSLIDEKLKEKKEESISLFSLSSFEQIKNEPQSTKKTESDIPSEDTPEKQTDSEITEPTEEQAASKQQLQEETNDNYPTESVTAEIKEKILNEAILESSSSLIETVITAVEQEKLARSTFLKSMMSQTQTVTKTDFFHHAKSIAQSPPLTSLNNTPTGNFSAKISGLGSLKFHSYEEKVRNALITAFNTIKHRFKSSGKNNFAAARTAIDLIINKDGSILQLYLVHSSGDTAFDKMIMESIKYAAPFPSIPNHLGIDKYRLGGMELYVNY